MSLNIITKKPNNYFSQEYLKSLGRMLFKKNRGPQAVISSLLRGLEELHQPVKINSTIANYDIVYVNESMAALQWATELKRKGKIGKLIAGPNLVVAPDEFNSLVCSSEIDKYLLPSEWVKNWWLSLNPELATRLEVWAAGVKEVSISNKTKDSVLVYKKNINTEIFQAVINKLREKGIKYIVVNYGQFRREDYFSLLDNCYALIYLQESESQGIALVEAWAKNVPTFVLDNKIYKYKNYSWIDEKIAAPYLTAACGAFFKDVNGLSELLDSLSMSNNYEPRNYYLSNFTDRICAEKFIQIISK